MIKKCFVFKQQHKLQTLYRHKKCDFDVVSSSLLLQFKKQWGKRPEHHSWMNRFFREQQFLVISNVWVYSLDNMKSYSDLLLLTDTTTAYDTSQCALT